MHRFAAALRQKLPARKPTLLRKRLSKPYMLNLPQDAHKSKVKIAEKYVII